MTPPVTCGGVEYQEAVGGQGEGGVWWRGPDIGGRWQVLVNLKMSLFTASCREEGM